MNARDKRLGTRCVHAGTRIDTRVGGVNTPIHVSSSFLAPNPEGNPVAYPRYMNIPTQLAASDKIAALEGAEAGIVVSSGLAAISSTLLALLDPGDHAVFQQDLYGGTHHFILAELGRLGVDYTLVASTDPEELAAAVRPETKVFYLESPTNPLLTVINLRASASAVKAANPNVLAVIDNTFATPINQRPLELGFDVSLHSGTKYLAGHSDLNCGAVVANAEIMKRVHHMAVNLGVTLNVLDCYLLERSMKTLALRMAKHNENGLAVAEYLSRHPRVKRAHYPGLPDDPGHAVASEQMDGFGGMLSFELDADQATAEAAVGRLKLVHRAISLGGVESLVCFPATTSHSKMSREDRLAIGVSDSLIRFSVGVEDAEDIIEDLDQAFVW